MSDEQGFGVDRVLENVGRHDVVEGTCEFERQSIVEIGLDEHVEPFAHSFVLHHVHTSDVVAE